MFKQRAGFATKGVLFGEIKMSFVWKVEFHCLDEDGDAFAWHETLDEAKAEEGWHSIEKHTYYHNDVETVCER
jgi:Na+-transporting NADH:ubiquinone oxidoreductase subunit NqrF